MANTTKESIKSMADVMKVIGNDMLEVDMSLAFFTFFRVWFFVLFSLYVTSISPWYLLPFAWIFQGTCMTGLFVIGHDCAHQSFSHSRLLNEIIGTICMSPLVFPYKGWEATHNNHHENANNIDKDVLWRPLKKEEVSKMGKIKGAIVYYFYGPLFFQSSLVHHAFHYTIPITARNTATKIGTARSIIFCIIAGYLTYKYVSMIGSFWSLYILPFLVFQFWLSTFTYFHHRNKDAAGWKKTSEWDKVFGGLFATVHVDFPAWIEYLTLDINWHLPHHASALIPWYNLRPSTYRLLKSYGSLLQTEVFSWKLWRETTTQCHLFSESGGFSPWH